MERNADETFGATGAQGGSSGASGSSGMEAAGSSAPGSGASASPGMSTGATDTSNTGGTNRLDQAKSTMHDTMGQVKGKARELQDTLAERLDAGADKLRQRRQSATLAGATGTAGTTEVADDKMAKMQDSLARGMNKSADWLRNGDLKGDIEKQVRDNPGRTLLVALGVGYLLGKAFRSNR